MSSVRERVMGQLLSGTEVCWVCLGVLDMNEPRESKLHPVRGVPLNNGIECGHMIHVECAATFWDKWGILDTVGDEEVASDIVVGKCGQCNNQLLYQVTANYNAELLVTCQGNVEQKLKEKAEREQKEAEEAAAAIAAMELDMQEDSDEDDEYVPFDDIGDSEEEEQDEDWDMEEEEHEDDQYSLDWDDIPYGCPLCPFEYLIPLELYAHNEVAHPEFFNCPFCMHEFNNQHDLTEHLNNTHDW